MWAPIPTDIVYTDTVTSTCDISGTASSCNSLGETYITVTPIYSNSTIDTTTTATYCPYQYKVVRRYVQRIPQYYDDIPEEAPVKQLWGPEDSRVCLCRTNTPSIKELPLSECYWQRGPPTA